MTVQVYTISSPAVAVQAVAFSAAGMEISFALDHDADARGSFEANFPDAYFEYADIRDA